MLPLSVSNGLRQAAWFISIATLISGFATAPAGAADAPSTTACGPGQIKLEGQCMAAEDGPGFCGPGYRPEGGTCVFGYKDPGDTLSTAQKEGLKKGCTRGLVWSQSEGCHNDD